MRVPSVVGLRRSVRRLGFLSVPMIIILVVILFVAWQFFYWTFCRIEIDPGMSGVLIAKMGTDLPPGEIIATQTGYKGIQFDVLSEGRHFYNPIFWDWELAHQIEIPANHVGVKIRLYGRDFTEQEIAEGKIIAGPGVKGIVDELLMPGRYRINPYAEKLEIHPMVEVPAGYVGVVTNLAGRPARNPNEFLVAEDEKGVTKRVLKQGIHKIHPYMQRVDLMDTQAQKFDFTGPGALKFPSSDAFEMNVVMSIVWAIDPNRAPEIFVRIGEMHQEAEKNEILQKAIIPVTRGYGRIEGSKYSAIDYIAGNSRQVFQNTLFEKIKQTCEPKGILIQSVLINDIEPPQEIAKPIRDREIAKEELNRNKNQLAQAVTEQSLADSDEKAKQEKSRVEAKTQNLVKIIDGQNRQNVAKIQQEMKLQVERTYLEAARKEAEAILARGKARADVALMQANAEANALKKSIEAFKSPEHFASYEFLIRVGPSIQSIFANTEGMFGRIFSGLIPAEAQKGGK